MADATTLASPRGVRGYSSSPTQGFGWVGDEPTRSPGGGCSEAAAKIRNLEHQWTAADGHDPASAQEPAARPIGQGCATPASPAHPRTVADHKAQTVQLPDGSRTLVFTPGDDSDASPTSPTATREPGGGSSSSSRRRSRRSSGEDVDHPPAHRNLQLREGLERRGHGWSLEGTVSGWKEGQHVKHARHGSSVGPMGAPRANESFAADLRSNGANRSSAEAPLWVDTSPLKSPVWSETGEALRKPVSDASARRAASPEEYEERPASPPREEERAVHPVVSMLSRLLTPSKQKQPQVAASESSVSDGGSPPWWDEDEDADAAPPRKANGHRRTGRSPLQAERAERARAQAVIARRGQSMRGVNRGGQDESERAALAAARRSSAARAGRLQRGALHLSDSERKARLVDNVFRTIAQDLRTGRTLYGVQMKETADVFKLMDRDGSETIDAAELSAALSRLEMRLSAEQLQAVLEAVDTNGNGTIELPELAARIDVAKEALRKHAFSAKARRARSPGGGQVLGGAV